jgi:hypothetical protein
VESLGTTCIRVAEIVGFIKLLLLVVEYSLASFGGDIHPSPPLFGSPRRPKTQPKTPKYTSFQIIDWAQELLLIRAQAYLPDEVGRFR